jgi:hypothetical protein
MKLSIDIIMTRKVFSSEPYDKINSWDFITSAYKGDFHSLKVFFESNPYLVHAYDTHG